MSHIEQSFSDESSKAITESRPGMVGMRKRAEKDVDTRAPPAAGSEYGPSPGYVVNGPTLADGLL